MLLCEGRVSEDPRARAEAMNGCPPPGRFAGGDLITGLRETVLAAQPSADVESIQRAFDVAARCHQGQIRRSGDPYITHPVSVAAILAGLGADDQTVCAAILHDTVEDTPYTLSALRHDFGAGIATLVADHTALDQVSAGYKRTMARAMVAITSADTRVAALKMADRLHNMRTLQFLPPETQLRKAREVLDVFGPAARQLRMETIGSELETLAFATLVRARPVRSSCYRTIIAVDIEDSTSRPDPVKAELRAMLYELFDAALRSAGIFPRHRDRFTDRGDGILALIRPLDRAPEALVLNRVIPAFSRLLDAYNASLPLHSRPQRQVRVRVVVHAGEVHYDPDGCFGEALDTAFRLLDAPRVKKTLKAARNPLVLVVSGDIYSSVVRHGYDQAGSNTYHRLVTRQIAGKRHPGWIQLPGHAMQQPEAKAGLPLHRCPPLDIIADAGIPGHLHPGDSAVDGQRPGQYLELARRPGAQGSARAGSPWRYRGQASRRL